MKDRTKLILFTVPAMAIMCLVVGGITTLILFEAGLAQQRARLVETVKSQARLMEVIARSKAHAPDARSAAAATLVLVRDAHKEHEGLGETGEFALARKEGDSIVFLLSHRHFDLEDPKPVPFDSALAEPMRRALLGQSGTVVGLDYRGARVLAAYEPVAELNWGIVAKIDLAEIRAPFVRAGATAGAVGLLVILAGAAVYVRVNNALLRRLEESAERFRRIFDHSNDAIFVIDPLRDEILDVNPTSCNMLGYTREELLSTPVSVIHPTEMPKLRAFAESVFQKGHGWTEELTCLTKAKETLPAEISASVFDMSGRRCLLAMVRDITERKRAARAIRESQERLSQILSSAMDAIVTVDQRLTIKIFNVAAEKIFRCTSEEVIGQSFERFASENLQNLLVRSMQACERGDTDSCLTWAPEGLTAVRADGEEFPLEGTISRAYAAGEALYTIILRDVNDRARAEERLGRLQLENIYLREEVGTEFEFEQIVGQSAATKKVIESLKQVAPSDSTVLIIGETGTGKELVAKAIHNLSPRKRKILVTVNCAALPAGLIESELFGHEKGAFTGALSRKVGRFELADGGTIFLDEIGDLPLELQPKLLRVLQEGEFDRVGSTETLKVDVRVIAATNRSLEEAIMEGRFRSDLYYRINIFPIRLPPLRERKNDIPLLVRSFAIRYGAKMGKKIETIPKTALHALMAYSWPGNVRELENIVERAVILSTGDRLELGDWIAGPSPHGDRGRPLSLEELERRHIVEVLELTGGRIRGEHGAAQILGMKPTTLESRMKRLSIARAS